MTRVTLISEKLCFYYKVSQKNVLTFLSEPVTVWIHFWGDTLYIIKLSNIVLKNIFIYIGCTYIHIYIYIGYIFLWGRLLETRYQRACALIENYTEEHSENLTFSFDLIAARRNVRFEDANSLSDPSLHSFASPPFLFSRKRKEIKKITKVRKFRIALVDYWIDAKCTRCTVFARTHLFYVHTILHTNNIRIVMDSRCPWRHAWCLRG